MIGCGRPGDVVCGPDGVVARIVDPEDPRHRWVAADYSVPTWAYLWTPRDVILFTPPLSEVVYGDGRAVFGIGTCHNRPAYWIIRGDSSWENGDDRHDVFEAVAENLVAEFGDGEPSDEDDLDPEDPDFDPYGDPFPAVDLRDGMHWFRLDDGGPR